MALTWSYEDLVRHFENQGEKYVSTMGLDHHEQHVFSGEGGVGHLYIPHYDLQNNAAAEAEQLGWIFFDKQHQPVATLDETPEWFRELFTQSQTIMRTENKKF